MKRPLIKTVPEWLARRRGKESREKWVAEYIRHENDMIAHARSRLQQMLEPESAPTTRLVH